MYTGSLRATVIFRVLQVLIIHINGPPLQRILQCVLSRRNILLLRFLINVNTDGLFDIKQQRYCLQLNVTLWTINSRVKVFAEIINHSTITVTIMQLLILVLTSCRL